MASTYLRYLFLLLIVLVQVASGQNIPFKKITVANGLSNNFVRTIHKDHLGFMWFGTLDGLDRFDGVETRSFSGRFPVGNFRVNAIADEPRYGIWVGTDYGLFFWDFIAEEFSRIELSGSQENVTTLLVFSDSERMLVGTSNGTYVVELETFLSRRIDIPDSEHFIVTGAVETDLYLWMTTSTGLIQLDVDSYGIKRFNNEDAGTPFNNFSAITIHQENLIVGTLTRGLFLFDRDKEVFKPYYDVGSNYILSLSGNQSSELYVGTDGSGLIVFDADKQSARRFVHDNSNPYSLNSNAVYALLVDENQRYWVGTYSGGVNYSSGVSANFPISIYENDMFIGETSIRSMFFDEVGNKFIGTREGLYVLRQDGVNHHFTTGNNVHLRSNVVLAFCEYNDDLLIGTFRGGVSRYDWEKDQLEAFKDGGLFMTGSIYGMDLDVDGNLIIGGMEGISRIDARTDEVIQYTAQNSQLVDDRIITIMYDSSQRLWVGSVGGTHIYSFQGDELVLNKNDLHISEYKAVSFYEAVSGNIWLATEGDGVCEIFSDLSDVVKYTVEDGLSNNSVTAITESQEGLFWITTLRGLSRYSQTNKQFHNYSLSDGLPSLVFNRGAIVDQFSTNGSIWLGSEGGLLKFYPDSLIKGVSTEKVLLTDLFLSGQLVEPEYGTPFDTPLNKIQELQISGSHGSIGFRFVALNFHSPQDNEYVFRLLGKDEEWKRTNNNTVSFSALKPGKYVFEVYLNDGVQLTPDRVASLQVAVRPRYYQSPLFLILVLLVISFLLFLIYRYIQKLKHDLKDLHKSRDGQSKYESSHLSDTRAKEIESVLLRHVLENQSFLNPDLKINELASDIDCSAHQLSQVINQNLNQSYYEFINSYRINAVKECMGDPKYNRFTLLAIAQQCGFSSKTSFYRAFKKLTGQSPQEYQNQIKSL